MVVSHVSQIRPKRGKHHSRETPHRLEKQQAMAHSVESLRKVRIHSINLVSIFNFVNDKIRKLYQDGDSGTTLHETMLHDRNLWPDDWGNFIATHLLKKFWYHRQNEFPMLARDISLLS
jgi:hypothetical protein